jgi:hypothetical protein
MIALGLAAFAALLTAAEGRAQTPNPTPAPATTPPSAKSLHEWHRGMARVPLPKKGCFTSSYPSTKWQEVPCTTAPPRPYPPARGPRSETVGGGNDVSANVTTGLISEAIGSFDSVTGVTSVSDPNGFSNFSLQLNSSLFAAPACNGAPNPGCQGWQQFVYSNSGTAFIQYWLVGYNTMSGPCPAGWTPFPEPDGSTDCYLNSSNAVTVPVQTEANLVNLSLTGQANSGGMDTIIMATGTNLYSAQNDDSALNLAQSWQFAEFNIFGDCCGTEASFNSGSTIVVRTSVDHGSPAAPSCSDGGFTAETNNLNFVQLSATPPTESLPAVVFTQSNVRGAMLSPCASATEISASSKLTDTHDFNGDGRSDILWRDSSGNAAVWLMNGTQIRQSAAVGAAGPNVWSIVGQRDFDGDGTADLLWRDTSGNVAIWFLDGAQITQSAAVGNASLTVWSILGTGDFNGDGKGDILWQDKSGNVAMWLMNGPQIIQSAGVGAANPTVWSIVGTGDFNGDGKCDILWQDKNGNVAMWLMKGPQIIQSASVGAADPTVWSIVGTGDFNGDGKSDILWQDKNGNVAIWFMNSTQISQSAGVGNASPTVWTIQGVNAD